MANTVIGSLPKNLQAWRGTAAELAEECNRLLPLVGMPEDAGAANERLVRHYAQVGILSPPEREGREAVFGHRQVVEFLVARHLSRDGWPLAKIAELVKAADLVGLVELLPQPAAPTPAEAALARIRGTKLGEPSVDYASRRGPEPMAQMRAFSRASEAPSSGSADLSSHPLARAADISKRRSRLRDSLLSLGNAEGKPARQRTVRISLTPWCQVYVDSDQLQRMEETTPDTLGEALKQALQDERVRREKKP